MRIPLTHYGRREMVLATAVCAVLAAAGAMLFWPAAVLPAAAWGFVILFFRDPQRSPEEADAFISPADGKVVDICPVGSESPLGERGTRIGIFMSLLDVHVNRSPCQGRVARVDRRAGGCADARSEAASETNASSTIVLAHERSGRTFPVVVRQIAGLVARRIVTDLRVGETVSAGQRIGMVKFGSRVELLVPEELIGEVRVALGQAVRAGRTALVRPPPGGQA
jgi:phosphatidylserine decarboxylase